jgi:hypothetical protein
MICVHCGTEFTPLRSTARFCSAACRVAAHRQTDCNANAVAHSSGESPPVAQSQVPANQEIERSTPAPKPRAPSKPDAGYRADDLQWKGDALHLYGKGRAVVRIVSDAKYPQMWRVELPDGRLSDMANRTWAKDAAISIACDVLSQHQ